MIQAWRLLLQVLARGGRLLTRPIELRGLPRLGWALAVFGSVGYLPLWIDLELWRPGNPAPLWRVTLESLHPCFTGLRALLGALALWLAVWAGLASLLTALTTFCFGLYNTTPQIEGLRRLWLALIIECAVAGVLAVPICILLIVR